MTSDLYKHKTRSITLHTYLTLIKAQIATGKIDESPIRRSQRWHLRQPASFTAFVGRKSNDRNDLKRAILVAGPTIDGQHGRTSASSGSG